MSLKALPFNIPKPEAGALIYQVDKSAEFYNKFHQHAEIQVSIILHGEGDLVVGDSVCRFMAGDIFVIGSNVPHLFKSDTNIEGDSHMLTLFFTKNSFGNSFFELEETKDLHKLVDLLEGGIKIRSGKLKIRDLFLKLEEETSLGRFIIFLEVMKIIAKSRKEALTTFVTAKRYSENQGVRMSAIMNFAMNEFHRDISLKEVAAVANMTVNAFCRFFKLRTNKTFIQLLTEIRLENACNLLRKKRDKTVAEIADLSGFNNISNFNRKFKTYKKITPTSYRRSF